MRYICDKCRTAIDKAERTCFRPGPTGELRVYHEGCAPVAGLTFPLTNYWENEA